MNFSVEKLTSIEECDAMTALVNKLTEKLSVAESVDRLASERMAERASQRQLDLLKVTAELESIDAQLGVVSDPQTRKELTYDKMVRQAKKYGLESKDDQGGVNALLLKEVEIASIAGEQELYGDLLAAIATHKASL